jgi:hypothetical protein
MIGDGLAIREAAYMEVDDVPGPQARQRRLRIAASAVVDFLCADHKVCRAKVFSGWRSPGAVKVRRIAYAALTDAGYTPTEIARAFGHDLTTVLRGKDIPRTGDPGDVLSQLKTLIANPPPFGPDARLAPVPEGKDTVQAMRRRYRRLLDEMLRAPTHARAVRLWKAWCRTEYPYSWKGTAATLPREYRLRHPDRLASEETHRTGRAPEAASAGGPNQHAENRMGVDDETNEGGCTSGDLQGIAQAG